MDNIFRYSIFPSFYTYILYAVRIFPSEPDNVFLITQLLANGTWFGISSTSIQGTLYKYYNYHKVF